MKRKIPRRLAIIGLPGSGKSTFATTLGKLLEIPVHHLDRHMFEPDGKKRDRLERLSVEQSMVNEASWIVEGCAMSTLETRFSRADTVLYFNFPRLLCVWRVIKRIFVYDKAISETGCARMVNATLLKYIWSFNEEKGPAIEALKAKFPQVDFLTFTCPKEAENYIIELSKLTHFSFPKEDAPSTLF